jgi:uncharacterized Tic20 family protein
MLHEFAHSQKEPTMPTSSVIDVDLPNSRAADSDERGLATTVHVVTLAAQVLTAGLAHVLVPAVSLFLFQSKSAWLKGHIKEQLNFQITYVVMSVILGVLTFFTFGLGAIVAVPVLLVLFIADIVCSIKAALAATRGDTYEFPFSIRLIK